jgi:membrane-associated phospholipid phosphatase
MSFDYNPRAMTDEPRTDDATAPPPIRWGRHVALPLALAPVLGGLTMLVDRPVHAWLSGVRPGGDLRRELETLGQFGSFSTLLVAALVIGAVQTERLRRVLDWVFAALLGSLVFNAMKILIGRGRPELGDPYLFKGPTGAHEAGDGEVLRALAGTSELRAMPSSHTTHAVIAAVFLGAMYPRLRPVVYGWAALVGVLRVVHDAHWPSDVVVGALVAYPLAYVVTHRYWGVRGLDWVWVRVVDRKATPAFPGLYQRERALHSAP